MLLCPIDFFTHSLLPSYFRSQTGGNVILCASDGYMHPAYLHSIPTLIRGATVFLTKEEQIRNLFKGKSYRIWDMIEFFAQCGIDTVAVYGDNHNQYLYDAHSKQKFEIPAYGLNIVDPIGAFASFCGGFGAGYTTHFDPLRSTLMGSVSASITLEGSTPLHTLAAFPKLAEARLNSLQQSVK